ncbi:hypothetical protein B0H10DRAFT_1941045 [Mycena sp. CBHHK59/15]|nr:hypothetical protein B0H10DRAFT_1941045 [Mycena sp. CBHHK59/15]
MGRLDYVTVGRHDVADTAGAAASGESWVDAGGGALGGGAGLGVVAEAQGWEEGGVGLDREKSPSVAPPHGITVRAPTACRVQVRARGTVLRRSEDPANRKPAATNHDLETHGRPRILPFWDDHVKGGHRTAQTANTFGLSLFSSLFRNRTTSRGKISAVESVNYIPRAIFQSAPRKQYAIKAATNGTSVASSLCQRAAS